LKPSLNDETKNYKLNIENKIKTEENKINKHLFERAETRK